MRGTRYVDFCVANAASFTYFSLPKPSHQFDLAAATFWEKKKITDASFAREVQEDQLIPFAVEASGRLGNAAVDYIHYVTWYTAEMQVRVV